MPVFAPMTFSLDARGQPCFTDPRVPAPRTVRNSALWAEGNVMTPFDHTRLAGAITPLLDGERVPDLGPGTPDRAALDRLRALTPESVAAPAPSVRDRDAARACLAGLWLLYDFLDESH